MEAAARSTAADYRRALSLMPSKRSGELCKWDAPVVRASAESGFNVDKCVDEMLRYHSVMAESGALEAQRREQRVLQMQASIRHAIEAMSHNSGQAEEVRRRVADGTLSPWLGATQLINIIVAGDNTV